MAYQLIWSPQAMDDIFAIAEFIARDSVFYAESVVSKIYETPQPLTQFPLMGRIVPEVGIDTVRELFVYQYRLVYEIRESSIDILAVIHGKRLLDEQAFQNPNT